MRANGYIMLGGFHNATMLMKAWRDRTRDKLYREDYHTLEQRRAKGMSTWLMPGILLLA